MDRSNETKTCPARPTGRHDGDVHQLGLVPSLAERFPEGGPETKRKGTSGEDIAL
jgi:hypothetical protein